MTPTATINNISVSSGPAAPTPAVFTVTLSAPAQSPIAINYATVMGTASAGAGDYVGVPSAELIIPCGQTTGTIAITVNPHKPGPPKNFFVSLNSVTSPSNTVARGECAIVPVSPPVNVVTIQPTDNVVKILNAAVKGQAYALAHNPRPWNFDPLQVSPAASGWSFDAGVEQIIWHLPTGQNQPQTCFKLFASGDKVTIKGGIWTTNASPFGIYAPTRIINPTTTDGAVQAFKVDSQFGHSGAGTEIYGGTFGWTNSCTGYTTQGITIGKDPNDPNGKNTKFRHSAGETTFRTDCDGDKKLPDNFTMDGVDFAESVNDKGDIEFRGIGVNGKCVRVTASSYIRAGQDFMHAADESIKQLLIDQVAFTSFRLPVNLMLKNGRITIGKNVYSVHQHPITMSGPAVYTFSPALTQADAWMYNESNVPGNVVIVGGVPK